MNALITTLTVAVIVSPHLDDRQAAILSLLVILVSLVIKVRCK